MSSPAAPDSLPGGQPPPDDLWRVFEASIDGITISTIEGELIEASPSMSAMHGYTPEEFVALPPGAYVHPDFHELRAGLRLGISQGRPYRIRAKDVRKDGTAFDVEVLGTPMMFRGATHVLAVVRDISEQVRAEQLLEQRVEQRTRELSTLLDVARDTSATLELNTLLDRVIDNLERVVDFTAVAINMNEEDHSYILARRGPGNVPAGARMPGIRAKLFQREYGFGRAVVIGDVRGPSELAQAYREMVGGLLNEGFSHVCSYMAVPLRGRAGVFGSVTVSWHEPDHYSEDDGRLLMAFADHVALAIESARLFGEAQQRTQELTTLLAVARSTSELTDLRTALDRIMDDLSLVLEFESVSLVVFEGDDARTVARRGPGFVPDGTRIPGARSGPLVRTIETNDPLIIDDAQDDSELARVYRETMGANIMREFGHVRSWMGATLRGAQGIRGLLTVSTHDPGHYKPEHARLLAAFAGHAAVAIENARLFDEAQRRTRDLEALLTVARETASTLDLETLFERIIEQLAGVLDYSAVAISLYEGEASYVVARRSPAFVGPRGERPRLRQPIFDARYHAGLPVIIDDVRGPSELAAAYREMVGDLLDTQLTHVQSYMGAPLRGREGTFGSLAVAFNEPGYYTETHNRLLMAFADHVAIAIDNARLYERAQQTASLEERQRLARELHDSVSQVLYGIALGARTARQWLDRDADRAREPLDYTLSLAEVGLAEMRALIFELRPESLESEGLVAALQRQANAIGARYELEVATAFDGEPEVTPRVREALYRIAQEAMHNTAKHAGASRLEVRLGRDGGGPARLVIVDDGKGFDSGAEYPGHLGLKSMAERVEQFGGSLDLSSAPGSGTTVTVLFHESAPA